MRVSIITAPSHKISERQILTTLLGSEDHGSALDSPCALQHWRVVEQLALQPVEAPSRIVCGEEDKGWLVAQQSRHALE